MLHVFNQSHNNRTLSVFKKKKLLLLCDCVGNFQSALLCNSIQLNSKRQSFINDFTFYQ